MKDKKKMKKAWMMVLAAVSFSNSDARRPKVQTTEVQKTEHQSSLKVEVDAQANKKRKILLVALSMDDARSQEACEALKRALDYTEQLDVVVEHKTAPYRKKEVLALKDAGYHFVLFLSDPKGGKTYDWRLYDTHKAVMQTGFKITKEGKVARGWGYAVADSIIPALTNNKPFAGSKLAYCQTGKKGETTVYIADFDGSYPEVLTHSKRQILAPRWNRDPENITLSYSRYTPINIQLIS